MSKQRNPNGMGTYKQRSDGRYEWRQKIDGKERYLSAKSMKELQEKVKKVADLPIISEKYTVAQWFDKWLESYIKPLKKQATYDQYNYIYVGHIKPVLGYRKMMSVKSVDVQGVIAEMNKKGMSTKTMKHAKTVMSGAFSKAMKDKIIAENPVKDIEIPVKQAKERKTLTNQELTLLFDTLKTSRWIWSAKFALVTGVRRGELLALKWTDIDFENKKITIDESNSQTGLGDTKSAKIHYVPLSDVAIEYLDKQKEMLRQELNPILTNEELKKTCLIFPSKYGSMIKPNSYYHVLSRAAAKVGFKASPHCLRHTFVHKTRDKFTIKELQAILGHDESTTTLDIYGDIISDDTFKVAKQIDDVFGDLEKETKVIKEKKEGKVIQFKRVK